MRASIFLSSLLASSVLAFPWLESAHDERLPEDFAENAARGLRAMKRDPELVQLMQTLYAQQKREEHDFFANLNERSAEAEDATTAYDDLEKRQPATCLTHPMKDFYPTNITGLKKFPEAAYPFKSPGPTDQRGACPGLNAMANHNYIPRNGIATVAQTIVGAAQLFNMGVDLSTFLAGGSMIFAGDIPSTSFSIGGADARTNSAGIVGGALGTETGLSGHLRFKECDASGTRCDFYLCNGDNHNLNGTIFKDLQSKAQTYGGGQYNVKALTYHFAAQYSHSRSTNPYFYFFPPQAALTTGASYFIAGFFSNGTIGSGGVANEASIASFLGAYFETSGSVSYMPERIPPQGWYRRGYPMFLPEAIDGIITLTTGASTILGQPSLYGANTGSPNSFNGGFSLSTFGGSGSFGGTTRNGVACAIEQAVYGAFISEFSAILNTATATLNAAASYFGTNFGCPVPSASAAAAEVAAYSGYPGYPKPSPCSVNKMQNGFNQCAPDTNTYGRLSTLPFCMNNPVAALPAANPLPLPGTNV